MAYDVNTDYKAKNIELQKQLAAATDTATKAALQAQINANDASRTEKMASDLQKYGKYATDSELDSAAGIMANNQIGTGYETQKANLNTSYDNAKQNANSDALSRGMARSSFVSDRLANLDSERANALSSVDAAKATAIQNAKTNILDNYRTNAANAATAEYNRKLNQAETLAQYGDVSGYANVGYTPEQITSMKNYLAQQALAKAAKGSSGSGSGSGSSASKPKLTAAQALAAYDTAGIRTPEVIAAYTYYYGDPNYGSTPKYAASTTPLNDIAADYQVGMNRGSKGQAATVQRMLESGQITEAQAEALLKKYGLL